jgi:STE24 endopeptidase
MAVIAFVVLLATLVVMIVLLIPWRLPLEGAPAKASSYFTAAQIQRSEAFHDAAKWPAWLGLVASLAGAVWMGFGGLGRRLSGAVRRRVPWWPAQVGVLVATVLAFQLVIALPFAVWSSAVSRYYGLTTQDWAGWLQDLLLGWSIALLGTALCMLGGVWLARRSPERWWIPAASGAAGLVFVVSFAYPVLVEPLFNRFSSMPASPLRTQLLEYAARDGIDVSDVLVADASRRTTAYNAYVSGFGSTKRLVLYDNLLTGGRTDQVKVVVAHELGHVRNHDVLIGTTLGAAAAATGVVGLFLLLRRSWWRRRVGADSAGDPAVVPLVLSLVVLVGFLALPVQNLVSRHVEARADLHSLDLTQNPTAFIGLQQRLAVTNISHLTPNPILAWWFDDHPTAMDRIAMAVAWADEHAGEP